MKSCGSTCVLLSGRIVFLSVHVIFGPAEFAKCQIWLCVHVSTSYLDLCICDHFSDTGTQSAFISYLK